MLPSSLSFHYFHYLTYSIFSKLYRSARLRDSLRAAAHAFKNRPISSSARTFRSRSRRAQSADTDIPVGPESAKREYAIERKLLEAPVLELSYCVDVVGVVPVEQRLFEGEEYDVGNGDTSPEWNLDLVVHSGFLRYGPWADRQRYASSSYAADSLLTANGCKGLNCSAYSSLPRTKRSTELVTGSPVRNVFGLLCEYSSSSAMGRPCTYLSVKRQR